MSQFHSINNNNNNNKLYIIIIIIIIIYNKRRPAAGGPAIVIGESVIRLSRVTAGCLSVRQRHAVHTHVTLSQTVSQSLSHYDS